MNAFEWRTLADLQAWKWKQGPGVPYRIRVLAWHRYDGTQVRDVDDVLRWAEEFTAWAPLPSAPRMPLPWQRCDPMRMITHGGSAMRGKGLIMRYENGEISAPVVWKDNFKGKQGFLDQVDYSLFWPLGNEWISSVYAHAVADLPRAVLVDSNVLAGRGNE